MITLDSEKDLEDYKRESIEKKAEAALYTINFTDEQKQMIKGLFIDSDDSYFLFNSPDNRENLLIYVKDKKDNTLIEKILAEFEEAVKLRGKIISVTSSKSKEEQNNYDIEIWLQYQDEKLYSYRLFAYDIGVIKGDHE